MECGVYQASGDGGAGQPFSPACMMNDHLTQTWCLCCDCVLISWSPDSPPALRTRHNRQSGSGEPFGRLFMPVSVLMKEKDPTRRKSEKGMPIINAIFHLLLATTWESAGRSFLKKS